MVHAMFETVRWGHIDRYLIQDSLRSLHEKFDSMSYFERKFYVGAIDGIESTADLAMLLSGDKALRFRLADWLGRAYSCGCGSSAQGG